MEFSGLSFDVKYFEFEPPDVEEEEEEEISFVEDDLNSQEEEPLLSLEMTNDLSDERIVDEKIDQAALSFLQVPRVSQKFLISFPLLTTKGLSFSGYGQASILSLQVSIVSTPIFVAS